MLTKRTGLIHNILSAYLMGLPITITLIFTYLAIFQHGIFKINMVRYGEYEIEIFMLLTWLIIFIVRLNQSYKINRSS